MNHSALLVRILPAVFLTAVLGVAQPVPGPGGPTPFPNLPPSGQAAPASASGEEMIGPITMPGDSIDSVLALIERWTGKTILRPQNLPQATLSINLRERITKKEAIQALETLLNLNGVAITPLGDRFLKVTALNAVKSEAPELIEGSTLGLPPSGRTASKLFTLQFLRVTEFMPQIAGLLNPAAGSPPVIFDKGNSALITDSLTNLQRVETLVKQLDKPSLAGLTPKFYQIRNGAKASDVVNKLKTIFSGPLGAQLGTSTTFNADDRTNQIALMADERQYPLFDELIAKLDVKSDPNTRNEVIKLKAAAAKDVATILSQLVTGQNNAAKTSGLENVSRNPNTPAAPGQNAAPPAAPTPAPALVISNLANQGVDVAANQFSALLTILPDERTNSLVVSGTSDDIRLIHELVNKIDVLLAQVRIEVVIAEVTLSDTDTSGINALNLTVASDATHGTHITNFDTGDKANGIAGWNITGGVVNPLAFQAALGNTGSKHNVKILSAPTLVTTHNKKAEFDVTQQQPIITGSSTTPISGTPGTATPYTNSTVTYRDIGIKLVVTPLIGEDGGIQLDIDQTVDDVISNVTIDGNVQPVIGHRQAKSYVNVADGQMIVLGGLQRNTHTRDRTKLGFLWEIPIISHLFGGRNNSVDRTELLLFVRPHVLPPQEGTDDTHRKIDELSNRDQVKQYLTDPTKQAKDTLREKIQ